MSSFAAIAVSLLLCSPTPPTVQPASASVATEPSEGPFRDLSLEAAFEAARSEDRPLLVALLGPDCGPCEAYDRFVFGDPQIAAWLAADLVAVRRFDDAAAAERFEVPRPPVVILATPQGVELDRIGGYLEPEAFRAEARAILEGTSLVGQARRALQASPADPEAHLQLAHALTSRGRKRDALEPFLWVFDHTREDPSWQERRLGPVLRAIHALRPFAPATEGALLERRDAASGLLLLGPDQAIAPTEQAHAAADLVALNQALGQARDTLRIWDLLRQRESAPPDVLAALLNTATQQLLLMDGRFADLLEGLGDPLALVQEELAGLQVVRMRIEQGELKPFQLAQHRGRALATVELCYQALLGAGREDDAVILVDLVLALEPGVDSYVALVDAGARAERPDLARALVERGLEALPEGPQRQRLKRHARQRLDKDD